MRSFVVRFHHESGENEWLYWSREESQTVRHSWVTPVLLVDSLTDDDRWVDGFLYAAIPEGSPLQKGETGTVQESDGVGKRRFNGSKLVE